MGRKVISNKDARLRLPGQTNPLPLSPRNANTMWMLHFLSHLKGSGGEPGGTAGFVMATGELSNSETARLAVRKALVEGGYVDCIVALTGQLFANTQIPCALWFLSKNRAGGHRLHTLYVDKPMKGRPTLRFFRSIRLFIIGILPGLILILSSPIYLRAIDVVMCRQILRDLLFSY